MGAQGFTNYGKGTDVQKAFIAVRDDARYEYGHGGYTGTIAEKGYQRVIHATPMPLKAAEHLAWNILNDDEYRRWPRLSDLHDKSGPAGAIAICSASVERTLTVRVSAELTETYGEHDLLTRAAEKLVHERMNAGESIASVTLEKLKLDAAPVVESFEPGRLTRRWRAVARSYRTGLDSTKRFYEATTWVPKELAPSYATRAAARKAATEWVTSEQRHNIVVEIEAVTVAAEQHVPAVHDRIEAGARTAAATAKVVVQRPRKGATHAGWLFLGTAGS